MAGGRSSRFKGKRSKLITPLCGQPIMLYPINTVAKLDIPIIILVGYKKEQICNMALSTKISGITFVEQKEQLGTGHAVLCTRQAWTASHILVINGDMPLDNSNIISRLWKAHIEQNASMSLVITKNTSPGLARIVTKDNKVRIVESKHFTDSVQEYPFTNPGIYLFKKTFLEKYLDNITPNKYTNEFYLTELLNIASDNNLPIAMIEAPFDSTQSINTLEELSAVEQIKKHALIKYWMQEGVRFYNPDTIRIDVNVTIGTGTVIGSGVHLLGNTTIGKFCRIDQFTTIENSTLNDHVTVYANSLIENSLIESHSHVGPYTHLSPSN